MSLCVVALNGLGECSPPNNSVCGLSVEVWKRQDVVKLKLRVWMVVTGLTDRVSVYLYGRSGVLDQLRPRC